MKIRQLLTPAVFLACIVAPNAQAATYTIISGQNDSGNAAQAYQAIGGTNGNLGITINDNVKWIPRFGTTFDSTGGGATDHPLGADLDPMNLDNKFTNTSVFGIDSATAMEYTYKFTEAGKYYYRCLRHSNMKGIITVTPGTAPTAQISGKGLS